MRPAEQRGARRAFVTPEGVDLRLELASASARAGAFAIDLGLIVLILAATTAAAAYVFVSGRAEIAGILWLIGFFALRNGWFALFEMGARGATPGKRLLALRVVARDGARLTGGAVIARNALREIELFLPLSFLGAQTAKGTADLFLAVFALAWTGIFLFFPLFNRDRLRIGDLMAGTWVVRSPRDTLGADLTSHPRPRRQFSDAALDLYGVFELQTLEGVLRGRNDDAVATVAATIRAKAGLDSSWTQDGDDRAFLHDYYEALCVRLERGLLVGRRRADKWAA